MTKNSHKLLILICSVMIGFSLALSLGPFENVLAVGPYNAYVVGARRQVNSVRGSKAYLTTPDVIAQIVGTDSYYSLTYAGTYISDPLWVETGAREYIPTGQSTPVYKPRTGWRDASGNVFGYTYTGWNLYPGGWYYYELHYKANSGGNWRTKIVDGAGTTLIIKDVPLTLSALNEVGSGGESTDSIGLIGDISTSYNGWQQWGTGSWFYYCYTTVYHNPSIPWDITPCGGSYDWTIHF